MALAIHIPSPSTGEDRGPILNQGSIAVYVLAVLVATLRFVTRGWITRKFGVDDAFIAGAIILGAGQTGTIILQVKNGRGRHTQELSIEQVNNALMFKWINMLIYFVAIWAVKMSILALYHRIGYRKRGLPWIVDSRIIWCMATFITAFTITIFFAEVFACTPISRSWDVEKLPKGCFYAAGFNMTQGFVNVGTDLILLIFPMPLLRSLKINTKQRLALVLIFSIGVIPFMASFMRLSEVARSTTAKGQSWLDADTTWTWAFVPLWSQVEVGAGIIAASLPSLSPLVKHLWDSFVTGKDTTPSYIHARTKSIDSSGAKNILSHTQRDMNEGDAKEKTLFYDACEGEDVDEEVSRSKPEGHIGLAFTADRKVVVERQDSPRGEVVGD